MLRIHLLGAAITIISLTRAAVVAPNIINDIDDVHIQLAGIKEKCLVEELPEKTVVLVKHSASTWNTSNSSRLENSGLQLLTTVRDPNGHTVVRQQSKPNDRLFLTAATTGDHLICFQAMMSQYLSNIVVKLGLEVFIGDAGDPHITSPVEAQLNDLAFQISKAVDQASDLQREQTLQRDREQHFRSRSDRINSNVLRWAFLQIVILAAAAFYQVHSMRRFFRYKKLI